jgi:hypothetical protein
MAIVDTTEMPEPAVRSLQPTAARAWAAEEAPLSSLAVRPGVLLHASYCPHNEAVASFLSGPGLGQRWTIVAPIAADELPAYLQARAEALAGMMQVTRGPEDFGKWN